MASNLAGYTLDFDVITTADQLRARTRYQHLRLLLTLDVSTNGAANAFKTVLQRRPAGKHAEHDHDLARQHSHDPARRRAELGLLPAELRLQQLHRTRRAPTARGSATTSITFTSRRSRRRSKPFPTCLFSWETPDNPATPICQRTIRRLDRRLPAPATPIRSWPFRQHGPTERSHALNIHRVDLDNAPDDSNSAFFTWGSQYILNSDPNQNGQIDDTVQQKIGALTGKINSATRVAFDVSFDPNSFDANPSFARFGLSVEDGTHSFQAEFPSFNPLDSSGPTTITMDMPLTAFTTGGLKIGTTDIKCIFITSASQCRLNVNGLFAGGTSISVRLPG